MACGCGNKKVAKAFEVTLPSGKTMTVQSEQQARIEVTRAGGGSYRPKK